MRKNIRLIAFATLLTLAGYLAGTRNPSVAHAQSPSPENSTYAPGPIPLGSVPHSYGRIAAVIPDQIGTGLIFEGRDGTIRFVSMTGMKEGELARYDTTPTHGGIPKSYGHLVSAVVNPTGTALVFEDPSGVIRFLTITGKLEGQLTRD
jgi:hypothetical protein